MDSNQHTKDSDCTVNQQTQLCEVCGVDHSDLCPVCIGRGFHDEDCPRNDAKVTDVEEAAEAAFWSAVASSFPRIKTGDLDPMTATRFTESCFSVIREWLSANEPDVSGDTAKLIEDLSRPFIGI